MRIEVYPAGHKRGSVLVIILVLLSVMAALIVANTTTLRRLKVELQLLELKQKRAYEQPTRPDQPAAKPAEKD